MNRDRSLHDLVRQSYGMNDDMLRIKFYPKILGFCYNNDNRIDYRSYIQKPVTENLDNHPRNNKYCHKVSSYRDKHQVQCDIDRSMWLYTDTDTDTDNDNDANRKTQLIKRQPSSQVSFTNTNQMMRKRVVLSNVILSILGEYPELHYYQVS